jgi:hypothetical protein
MSLNTTMITSDNALDNKKFRHFAEVQRCHAHAFHLATRSLSAVDLAHKLIGDHLCLLSQVAYHTGFGGGSSSDSASHGNEAFELLSILADASQEIVEAAEEHASRFSVSVAIVLLYTALSMPSRFWQISLNVNGLRDGFLPLTQTRRVVRMNSKMRTVRNIHLSNQ